MKKIFFISFFLFIIFSFAFHFSEYKVDKTILFHNAEEITYASYTEPSTEKIILNSSQIENLKSCMTIQKISWFEFNECVNVTTPSVIINIKNKTLKKEEISITDELYCAPSPNGRFIYPLRWKWNWLDRIFLDCYACGEEGIHYKVMFDKECYDNFLNSK